MQESFNILLSSLDPDRERAGEKYEMIRAKLMRFFEWNGCNNPAEHADEAFNRIARKLVEGEVIRDLASYANGVARLLLKEVFKDREKERKAFNNLSPSHHSPPAPDEPLLHSTGLDCLDACLGTLPPETRDLILSYYQDDGHTKIQKRKQLAEHLGLQKGTLRIKAHRIRAQLEKCVNRCMKQNM